MLGLDPFDPRVAMYMPLDAKIKQFKMYLSMTPALGD
jgi:hypothetical protein